MSYGYSYTNGGKSYEQFLDEQIDDESKAGPLYEHMALLAEQKGMRMTAELIRSIAKDENKHFGMLSGIKAMPEVLCTGGYTKFPSSIGEWVDLALRVKSALYARGEGVYEVNGWQNSIEQSYPDSEEAKRRLTIRAGELGIW